MGKAEAIKTLAFDDQERVALIWGLQLTVATAFEQPEDATTKELRERLLKLNQRISEECPLTEVVALVNGRNHN